MRIGMPHMGNLHITLKTLFERLGVDYVIPPSNSQRTLSLGAKYSPEGLCIPFKLTLGNLIECAAMGADTLLMPGGNGICRLGYYAKVQQQVLREIGYNAEIVELGVSERKLIGFMQMIKRLSNDASWYRLITSFRFALAKLHALDAIERSVQKVRPAEQVKGAAQELYTSAIEAIDGANDYASLKKIKKSYLAQLDAVPRQSRANPLKVRVIGEFYVVLEPFSNLDVEVELGKLGVEVRRTTFISEWTKFSLFLNPLGINEKERYQRAAMPYLKHDVGGEGWESVGEKVLHAGEDYDGIIHLAPFTCMPEIVAQNIMPTTQEDIPVLTILCDEQMGKAGMLTRLEAFVDLLERRRRARLACNNVRRAYGSLLRD
ncbi:MAG: CoA protein activase [Chloroflexi bacterium]|nr:CoA protein activase [Chloroflexota bacterium]